MPKVGKVESHPQISRKNGTKHHQKEKKKKHQFSLQQQKKPHLGVG